MLWYLVDLVADARVAYTGCNQLRQQGVEIAVSGCSLLGSTGSWNQSLESSLLVVQFSMGFGLGCRLRAVVAKLPRPCTWQEK
jgi:hypothetical protein